VSLIYVVISLKTSQRLQHETEFRTKIKHMTRKLEFTDHKVEYDFQIPYLHIRDEIIWLDVSRDKRCESQYVKRFDPVFYEYVFFLYCAVSSHNRTHTHAYIHYIHFYRNTLRRYRIHGVIKLIPIFFFVMYFTEGFVLGVIDFHSNEIALWLMIVLYFVHLFALIFLFPSILPSDNMWRIFRVMITIGILFLSHRAYQNGDDVGDCNVAMLLLWVILIYMSVIRVAYNFILLLLAGVFTCCCSACCKKEELIGDRIDETRGAGFGEDKDLGRKFIGTWYFATFARETEERLDDNVFESKPSEMNWKKMSKNSFSSPPPPSPPSRLRRRQKEGNSRRNSGTTRIDMDSAMIPATPSDLKSEIELRPMDSFDPSALNFDFSSGSSPPKKTKKKNNVSSI